MRQADSAPVAQGSVVSGDAGFSLASVLGNRTVAQALNDFRTALLRTPEFAPSGHDPLFNAESIANVLRRAINQSEAKLVPKPVLAVGPYHVDTLVAVRSVDAATVIRVLDDLTPGQVYRVEAVYRQLERRPLEQDLFEGGESGIPSDLTPEQEARIRVLLGGTRAELPGEAAPDGRIEADAIELHGLLSDDLDEAGVERVMALHRRPVAEIDRLDAEYRARYQRVLPFDLIGKLTALQDMRVTALRAGDWAVADAHAIEEKRQALEALATVPETPWNKSDTDKKREQLIGGINAIVEANRREALADPANISRRSDQVVQERLSRVLAAPMGEGVTLGAQLAATLGPTRGGAITALAGGSLVEAAAQRLVEMEATGTTKSEKIAALLQELRAEAEHDVLADPWVSVEDKVAIASHDPAREAQSTRLVDLYAQKYTAAFVETYERLRDERFFPDARPWTAIVASASKANQDLLNALQKGGGRLSDLDELDIAIRKEDAEGAKAVLRRQHTRADIVALDAAYHDKRGKDLRHAFFGSLGSAELAEKWDSRSWVSKAVAPIAAEGALESYAPFLTGRDAALADEYLSRPAETGGLAEVQWIAQSGRRELDVTEARSGAMGWLRELGDLPETQSIMRESAKTLDVLLGEWERGDPWARPRSEIRAEMLRWRSTLTGDLSAYEAENARMVAELRAAVSFVVQVALAAVLPGFGTGVVAFLSGAGLNIAASVASNAVIYGDEYGWDMFSDDVKYGLLAAGGAKFGEEVVGKIASEVAGRSARDVAGAAEGLGVATRLAEETGAATKYAKAAGGYLGASTAIGLESGRNPFTLQSVSQIPLARLLGRIIGARSAGGGGRPRAPGKPLPRPQTPTAPPEPVMLFDWAGRPAMYQGGVEVPAQTRLPLVLGPTGRPPRARPRPGRIYTPGAQPVPPGPVPLYVRPEFAAGVQGGRAPAALGVPLYVSPTERVWSFGARRVGLPRPVPLWTSPTESGLFSEGLQLTSPYVAPQVPQNEAWRAATASPRSGEWQANADFWDMTQAEYVASADAAVARLVENAEVRVRAPLAAVNQIVGTGRLLTQFETGTTGGLLDPNARRSVEAGLWATPPEAGGAERPIYGYLSGTMEATTAQYGDAVLRLRPGVRARTTFTFGDSLDETARGTEPRVAGEPLTRPSALAAQPGTDPLDLESLGNVASRVGHPIYTEAQVHGGVTLADIEEVVFTNGVVPSPQVRAALDSAGIPWRIVVGPSP